MTITDLLKAMVAHSASDLYLTVGVPPSFRIEGRNARAGKQALAAEHLTALASSLMNEEQREEFARELEMNLALSLPEVGRFRVNIFRQRGNVGIVIRRIRGEILTIEQLGLPSSVAEVVHAKRGLILVVGATGSGKSTTLAAMVDHWNSSFPGHIITIEDPVEFVHHHKQSVVTQREVGVDTHSFGAALKNALRQAPDVILLGEIRDTETMEAAVAFAETGHLCLGTLHANNSNQAMERVLNFFPAERHPQILLQLSLNLRAILSQRLIPTVDGKRAAAIEILRGTPRAADLIKRGEIEALKVAMAGSAADGMQTFDQALFALYEEGRITLDNALAHADSANDLRLRVRMGQAPAEPTKEPAGGPKEGSGLLAGGVFSPDPRGSAVDLQIREQTGVVEAVPR